MKNLMVHLSPKKGFAGEYRHTVKLQIYHSLKLGWERKDIILITNFDYSYMGVKSFVVDDCYCDFHPRGSKINAIIKVFDWGIGDFFWYHDLDAFQMRILNPDLDGYHMGIVNYIAPRSRDKSEWNSGSFFFDSSTRWIFKAIRNELYKIRTNEEHALLVSGMDKYCKKLSPAFNFGITGFDAKTIDIPIKVAHFHPMKKRHMKYMAPFLTPRLRKSFKQHGFKIQ